MTDSALPKLQSQPARLTFNAERVVALLMLGGASLILLPALSWVSLPTVIVQENIGLALQQITTSIIVFAVLLSYPHFIWSYRFAYQQGTAFIFDHAWQLIAYPLFLVALLGMCVFAWSMPVASLPPLLAVDNFAHGMGVELYWSKYNGFGQLLFATTLIVQTIWSGHHYCLQAFGVSLACAQQDGFRFQLRQKRLLLINLYALWIMNLLSGYTFFSMLNTGSFAYHPTRFPPALCWASYVFFGATVLALLVSIILPAVRQKQPLPSVMAIVPVVSIWAWLQPFAQPFGFQATVAPIAHGAQYLHFAFNVEAEGFDEKLNKPSPWRPFRLLALCLCLISLGYLLFIYLPGILDRAKVVNAAHNFFFLAAYVFISMHHYVVDSVVWKRDSRARQLLKEVTS